jgi:uncharacterized protein YecE (DUF72 family)
MDAQQPRVGTAGWSIRSEHREAFASEGSHLERYARRFNAVEINSSFYRPHRQATYVAAVALHQPSTLRSPVNQSVA